MSQLNFKHAGLAGLGGLVIFILLTNWSPLRVTPPDGEVLEPKTAPTLERRAAEGEIVLKRGRNQIERQVTSRPSTANTELSFDRIAMMCAIGTTAQERQLKTLTGLSDRRERDRLDAQIIEMRKEIERLCLDGKPR